MNKKCIVAIAILFLFISSIFISPSTSYACFCGGLTVEEAFLDSRAVFSGKVIEIEADPYKLPKNVLFEIHEVWKGDVPSQMVISTGEGGNDCGFLFEEGTEYLVYARESNMFGITDNLVTHSCSRTNEISLSEEDLQFLGAGSSPLADTDGYSHENGEEDKADEPSSFVGLEDVEPSTAYFVLGIISLTLFIIVLVFYFSVFKKRKKYRQRR